MASDSKEFPRVKIESGQDIFPEPGVKPGTASGAVNIFIGSGAKKEEKAVIVVPFKPRDEYEEKLYSLANVLVGALGQADVTTVWTNVDLKSDLGRFEPKQQLIISAALADISDNGWTLASIAYDESATAQFAALVQYHTAMTKVGLKGTYQQPAGMHYLLKRYDIALLFFRRPS